eukprot:CCRYP_015296-RA/>CCRYP_015296-RA protein AED:0.33 eAED:0.35 QI:23/0/0/1/0/0/3/0/304
MVEAKYLDKVHTVKDTLTLHTNAGKSHTNKKGYLGGTAFWLDEKGIANVVSEQDGGAFVCHTKDGAVVFKRCTTTGFPFVDLSKERNIAAAVLIQTVRQNFEGYTREEVERAIMARKMQSRSGHPSEATFKREVSCASASSLFDQSPITSKDVANARQIFGPSEACIKGKWVRGRPEVVRPTYVLVPEQLINLNRYVTLAADVMFVSGLPFLVTLSRREDGWRACQHLETSGRPVSPGRIHLSDRSHGWGIRKVKKKLINIIEVNITSKNEHVPEIERKIRHIKERVRSIRSELPYTLMPGLMI